MTSAKRGLPSVSPELAARKVGANCHIGFNGAYYSVPHGLFGQMVFIRASDFTVDILNNNGVLVASHKRCFVKRRYITNPDHMPEYYHSFFEDKCYDARRLRLWAKDIGDHTNTVIETLLARRVIEEQSYKSCMAVLQLSKKYGASLLERSCSLAINGKRVSYTAIKKIIAAELENRSSL